MTNSPRPTIIEAVIEMYGERPLPPIPRIPSSIYYSSKRSSKAPDGSQKPLELPEVVAVHSSSVTPLLVTRERIGILNAKTSSPAKHLSQLCRKDKGKISSPFDKSSERRKFARATQSRHGPEVKAIPSKPVPFTEWKAPAYREPSNSSESSLHTCLSQRTLSFSSTSPAPTENTLREQEASYFATVHHDELARLERGVYDSDLNPSLTKSPLPVTVLRDEAKQANVPYPLITCLPIEIPPSSRFSPSSPTTSDVDGVAGIASSLRTRAKKAFLKSKTPKRPGLQHRLDSDRSNISYSSHVGNNLSSKNLAEVPERNGMEEGSLKICDNLQSNHLSGKPMSTLSRERYLSKEDQISPPEESLSVKETRDSALFPMDYQSHYKNIWKKSKKSKKHPYVYRKPRKRLPKPQPSVVPFTTATMANTTCKIKTQLPPTPKRPRTSLLFDYTYQIELQSPVTQSLARSLSLKSPTRNNPSKSHRLSHSITESTSRGNRLSRRLSKLERKQPGRYSLPVVSHTRQNSNDTISSRVTTQASISSARSRKAHTAEQILEGTTLPTERAMRRKKTDPLQPPLDSEEEEDRGRRGRKDKLRAGKEDKGRQTSSLRRREELKKRIVVMGDPSAVGVPF